MALVVNDRVKETSTTTGTGTLTLDGAVTGFETFSSAIGNTNTTYYAIELPNTAEFEVGRGTVSAGQLARTEVISSSNSDNPVNFSAGTKNVFCTLPASKAVIKDASDNVIFGDNEKAQFGDSNDLEIYHNGTNSYIDDSGTGILLLRSDSRINLRTKLGNEDMLEANPNGSVELYYDNSKKIETTNTGATITGTLISDGLTVDTDTLYVDSTNDRVGIGTTNPGHLLHVESTGSASIMIRADSDNVDETHTARLSMTQDGATSSLFDVGIEGNAGTEFTGSLANAPYLHAKNATSQPLQLANAGSMIMTLRDGKVGIGTSSPSTLLHLSSSDPQITITDTDGTGSQVIKAVTDDLEFDAVGDIILDADDAGQIHLKDGGTEYAKFYVSSGNYRIESTISDGDINFKGNDGGVSITALTLDMSEAGAATFNDKVTLGANKVIEFGDAGETISGDGTSMTISSSSNINLDAAGGITLDAGTSGIKLDDDGSTIGLLYFLSGNLNIKPSQSDTDLVIKGNDGGSEITALTLDMSEAGAATFNSSVTVGANLDVSSGTIKLDGNHPEGTGNVALGDGAGAGLTTGGQDNTLVGRSAGTAITTGDNNIGIGAQSLQTNSTGNANLAIGYGALLANTASNNLAIGHIALTNCTTGTQNTMVGRGAGEDITTSVQNTGFGYQALANTTASENTAVGHHAALFLTTGATNVAIGRASLQNERAGGLNTSVGAYALSSQNGGSQNTALGRGTGSTITTGSNLTCLGYDAEPSSATATNEITLGNSSVTSLRIPGLASGASSGDVLTYDGTDITLSAPTGVSAGFSIAMAIAL